MKVLIVEDDTNIAESLRSHLEAESFAVDVAGTAGDGIRLGSTNDYDLVILDLTLPDKEGGEVVVRLRERSNPPPILVLTVISDSSSKVRLLTAGADDYLEKPFLLEELTARMRALLRRPRTVTPTVVSLRKLTVDTGAQSVLTAEGEIPLTRKEYAILEYLARNRGMVVSRAEIVEHVWDSSVDLFAVSLDTHIMNLRRKLDDYSPIETVHGRGYLVR